MTLLSVGLAASCAGGVCGDHLSPISDTTIMLLPAPTCFHLTTWRRSCLWYHRGRRFLRQLHHCRSGPERCGLHDHRHRADGRYSAGHQAVVAKKHAGVFAEMAEANKVLYQK